MSTLGVMEGDVQGLLCRIRSQRSQLAFHSFRLVPCNMSGSYDKAAQPFLGVRAGSKQELWGRVRRDQLIDWHPLFRSQ